ncbi:PGAP6-like protein [Mya arenaria]|uniref:PGAP6-like protein n=1 Tax=Mya arenaria TaxID=6604 RepID=A0ABY7FQ96_MYAAR|nr:PGAP6-like protein [Mya arenaria]
MHPKNFYIDKKWAVQATFNVTTTNLTMESTLINPKPGPWYSVAYLPERDGKILPADLFVKCVYRLRNWFSVRVESAPHELTEDTLHQVRMPPLSSNLFRFLVPVEVYKYQVILQDCYSSNNQTGCDVTIATRGLGFPGPSNSTVKTNCEWNVTTCEVTMEEPSVGVWNYLEIFSHSTNETINASVDVRFKACKTIKTYKTNEKDLTCQMLPLLDKFTHNSKFKNRYGYMNGSEVNGVNISLSDDKTHIVPFIVSDGQDNGGSLEVRAGIQNVVSLQENYLHAQVNICVQREVLPYQEGASKCSDGFHSNMTSQGEDQVKVIVPYPQAGHWFVGVKMNCYRVLNDSDTEVMPCGQLSAQVNVSVMTDACVGGGCSQNGRCINYLNGHVLYTTCRCVEGWRGFIGFMVIDIDLRVVSWRGFDCSDGSDLESDSYQLQELLLLTLSNLVFIPAIVLASYRRYYVEALVFAYNMVFSAIYQACDEDRKEKISMYLLLINFISLCNFLLSCLLYHSCDRDLRENFVSAADQGRQHVPLPLYHSCDGDRREEFSMCPLPINVVSVCDFLSSATSIWITLVAMARPPLQWKSLIQMAGPLALLVGVLYRKTSAFLFLVPAGVGLIMLLISWKCNPSLCQVCRCCYRGKCYPSRKRYLLFLVPGLLLAAGGLCIFTFVEREDNYLYTHSAWHVCMALSVLLLLPPRDSRVQYKVKDQNGTSPGPTYQPISTFDRPRQNSAPSAQIEKRVCEKNQDGLLLELITANQTEYMGDRGITRARRLNMIPSQKTSTKIPLAITLHTSSQQMFCYASELALGIAFLDLQGRGKDCLRLNRKLMLPRNMWKHGKRYKPNKTTPQTFTIDSSRTNCDVPTVSGQIYTLPHETKSGMSVELRQNCRKTVTPLVPKVTAIFALSTVSQNCDYSSPKGYSTFCLIESVAKL